MLSLAESAAQLGQRNVLQLPNTLPRDAEIFTDVFQSFRLSTVETETLRDDFLLPIIEDFEEATHFVAQVLVPQQLERTHERERLQAGTR